MTNPMRLCITKYYSMCYFCFQGMRPPCFSPFTSQDSGFNSLDTPPHQRAMPQANSGGYDLTQPFSPVSPSYAPRAIRGSPPYRQAIYVQDRIYASFFCVKPGCFKRVYLKLQFLQKNLIVFTYLISDRKLSYPSKKRNYQHYKSRQINPSFAF